MPISRYFPIRTIFITAIIYLLVALLILFIIYFCILLFLPYCGDKPLAIVAMFVTAIICMSYFILHCFVLSSIKDISNFITKCVIKPQIIINTKGDDLYDETKRIFDYDGEKFRNLVDRMQEKGFNLECYSESGEYCYYNDEIKEPISISKTFIGCLIWLNAIAYVDILLKKGVKVDERENWVEKCLHDHQFEMVELLIRNKVKSNLNSGTFYLGLTDAEIGHRIRDLIVNMLNICKSESEYAGNRIAIKEALLILEATTQENDKIKELESRVESLEASRPREPGAAGCPA